MNKMYIEKGYKVDSNCKFQHRLIVVNTKEISGKHANK